MKPAARAKASTTRKLAGNALATAGTPWRLPRKPADPTRTAQAHVLANAASPRVLRVCYTAGPDDSFVAARANTNGAGNIATNIYLGGCVDIGGTDIELTNPNAVPVSGTYELVGDK